MEVAGRQLPKARKSCTIVASESGSTSLAVVSCDSRRRPFDNPGPRHLGGDAYRTRGRTFKERPLRACISALTLLVTRRLPSTASARQARLSVLLSPVRAGGVSRPQPLA